MRKFKLKIWYPSLDKNLKVGDIVECRGLGFRYKKPDTMIYVEPKEVENNL